MSYANNFTHGVRVANFTDIDLPVEFLLQFNTSEIGFIIAEIRRYADLPYVFVAEKAQVEKIRQLLDVLRSTRSRCYPVAIFTTEQIAFEATDIEVIHMHSTDAQIMAARINAYAEAKFTFDEKRIKVCNSDPPPASTDVAIIGAGVTGLYAAQRLKQKNISFCVLDKREKSGGIWSMYANSTSRVNTSEGAYRLIEKSFRANRDHSATREILEDIADLSAAVSDHLFLQSEVQKIEKTDNGYRIKYLRNEKIFTLESKGVILAINDRVGSPRRMEWPGHFLFQGEILAGISDNAKTIDWRNKNVVILGMGAFAVENARTALEGGARHVTVLCRRHGTICPKIIDYLNFATPYDKAFKHDNKSNIRNMMYWKKLYGLSGATQPECWMAKIKHPGHTISVSDIWFIAHYLKKLTTKTTGIATLTANGLVTDNHETIAADIIINCIGFERNASAAKKISGCSETYNTNYLDKDFMYLADAYIDDDAFNSFFGSSVLEMVKFYLEVYIKFFNSPEYEKMTGCKSIEKVDIETRKWSHYITGAAALIQTYPDIQEIAGRQVDQRTRNFLEQHDLETYIAENKREWFDTHALLAGRPMGEEECLPYVFEKLLPIKG